MSDEEIERFIRLFEETSLPRSEWTHGKHLIVALVYLTRHRRDEAMERIRQGIRRLNQSYGNFSGYHETITLAWIAVVSRFLTGGRGARASRSCPVNCWRNSTSRITCFGSTPWRS